MMLYFGKHTYKHRVLTIFSYRGSYPATDELLDINRVILAMSELPATGEVILDVGDLLATSEVILAVGDLLAMKKVSLPWVTY